jgi:hypothetical protein
MVDMEAMEGSAATGGMADMVAMEVCLVGACMAACTAVAYSAVLMDRKKGF